MSTELGTAYVSIVSSTRGLGKDLKKQFGSMESSAAASGQKSGKGWLKGFAVAGAVAGVASKVFGGIVSGIKSYGSEAIQASDATDKFKQTLQFGGVKPKVIDAVTKQVRTYADQTVYSLADVQSMTAQLAANGVPDYEKLGEAAGNLNAAAGGNADTFRSVALVMTQTAGAGKLTTQNYLQLANAIPGASGLLQKQLRKNKAFTGDFATAMSKGQISATEFNKAVMQLGMTDVAKKAATSTKTIEGSWGNLQATIVGGLGDAISWAKPAITGVMNWINDELTTGIVWVRQTFTKVRAYLSQPAKVAMFKTAWAELKTGAQQAVATIKPILAQIVSVLIGKIIPAIISTGKWIVRNKNWLSVLAVTVGTFVGVFRAVTLAMTAWKAITDAVKVAQIALNVVMRANPAGLVIAGISALVAGLVWFFTKTETGRKAWKAFTTGMVTAWRATSSFLVAAWHTLASTATSVFNGIKNFFKRWGVYMVAALGGPVALAVTVVVRHWGAIKAAFSAGISGAIAIARTLGSRIKGVFAAAGSWLVGAGRSIMSGLRSGITGAWGAVTGFIGSIPGRVRGALSGAGSWLVGVGRNIIGGLKQGLEDAIGSAVSAATSLVDKIPSAVRKILGIHSPSRVFAAIGKNIVAGLALGISTSQATAVKAIQGVVAKVSATGAAAVKGAADKIYNASRRASAKTTAANRKAAAAYQKSVQAAAAKRDRALAAADKISNAKAKARAKTSARAAYTASVNRAKATKLANTKLGTPTITKAQATAQAKKQLAAALAAQKKATAILTAQTKTSGKLWKNGVTRGTDYMLRQLNGNGTWKKGTSKVLKATTLADLAKARENIAGRLATANAALKEQVDASNSLRDSVASSLQSSLDLSSHVSTTADDKTNFGAISSWVHTLAAKAKTFAGKIKALIKAGMPAGLVQEIAGLGIESGLAAANAILSASKTSQKGLFSDYNSFISSTTNIGSSMADQMYGAGIASTKGLIDGLNKDDAKLKAAAKHLADTVVKEAKKALGIHSPSQIMRRQVGRMSGEGVALGLDDSRPVVARQARRLLDPSMLGSPQLTLGGQGRYASSVPQQVSFVANGIQDPVQFLTSARRHEAMSRR